MILFKEIDITLLFDCPVNFTHEFSWLRKKIFTWRRKLFLIKKGQINDVLRMGTARHLVGKMRFGRKGENVSIL